MRPAAVNAFGEIMSSLATGSSFWHGSHTRSGNVADNRLIGILAYIMYQEGVANLNPSTPVLRDLGDTFRPYSAVDLSDQLTDMYLTKDVSEWEQFILDINMPNYYRTFAGFVVTLLTYTTDDATADEIINTLAELFNFPQEEYEFLFNKLLPEVRPQFLN